MEVSQGTPAPSGEAQTAAAAALTPEQNNQTAPPVAKVEDNKDAQRFIELRRREVEAQKVRSQQKARETEFKQMQERIDAFERAKANARLNPLDYLKAANLSPDDLVQYQLNNNAPTPDLQFQQLKAELEETKQSLRAAEERKQIEAKETNERQAAEALENFKHETKDFVMSKPDDYELINETESHDLVIQTIEEHWAQSVQRYEESGNDPKYRPKILDRAEAAGLVEKFLEDKVAKVLAGKKFGSKYKKIEEAVAEVAKDMKQESGFTKTIQTPQPTVKPLHNGMVVGATPPSTTGRTMQEKMAAAAKILQAGQKG